jgi:hypothetical protein
MDRNGAAALYHGGAEGHTAQRTTIVHIYTVKRRFELLRMDI